MQGLWGFIEVLALMGLLGRWHTTCTPTPHREPPHCSAWGGGRLGGGRWLRQEGACSRFFVFCHYSSPLPTPRL